MFGHKINVPKDIFGYLRAIVFLQLTLCITKEFSKIGNKVFIPSGVKNLFPKIEPLAKHIVLRRRNQKLFCLKILSKTSRRKNIAKTADVENVQHHFFNTQQKGSFHSRPAIAPFRLRRVQMNSLTSCHGI